MSELFTVGQKVVFRRDWLNGIGKDADLERWDKLPYMTVISVEETDHFDTYVELAKPVEGTWDYRAITAHKELLPEDLFTL